MHRLSIFCLLLTTSLSAVANAGDFIHCYDFGCKSTQSISFSAKQWDAIHRIFRSAAPSAFDEKQQIREAVAVMESYAALLTGTHDLGENYTGIDNLPGQQDCIDESTNTMQYLHALEQRKWLKFHRVSGNVKRTGWLFYVHWTAVIEQTDNHQLFAVDSWYRDNGQPPYLQTLEHWIAGDSFPDTLNPPL